MFTQKKYVDISLLLLSIIITFHICLIAKFIPYSIAWSGQLRNDSDMYVFEVISILINFFLALIILMKGNYVKYCLKRRTTDIILWVFIVLFALNTIVNICAKTNLEKSFAILTLVFVVLIWKILNTKAV